MASEPHVLASLESATDQITAAMRASRLLNSAERAALNRAIAEINSVTIQQERNAVFGSLGDGIAREIFRAAGQMVGG